MTDKNKFTTWKVSDGSIESTRNTVYPMTAVQAMNYFNATDIMGLE